jgi:hypothetical protein
MGYLEQLLATLLTWRKPITACNTINTLHIMSIPSHDILTHAASVLKAKCCQYTSDLALLAGKAKLKLKEHYIIDALITVTCVNEHTFLPHLQLKKPLKGTVCFTHFVIM